MGPGPGINFLALLYFFKKERRSKIILCRIRIRASIPCRSKLIAD